MDSKTFFDNFETIANAPGGIARLRELVLDLAVRGKLTEQTFDEKRLDIAETDGPFEIPNNWLWSALEGIADYGGRGNASPNEIVNSDWVLDLEDIEKTTSRLIDRVLSKDRKTTSAKARFETGDVLYGKLRPYLDKVLVADSPGYCTTEIIPITPKFGINPQWLRISLKSPSFIGYVTDRSYGMKMPRLGTKDAKSSLHPVPPIEEQQRIVAKVDELMALCDELEAAQNQRNSIRTSARKSAIDAISTATTPEELDIAWKRISYNWLTIADTPESVASLRSLIHDVALSGAFGGANTWRDMPLGDISKISYGYTESANRQEVGPKFLRITDIQNGVVDWDQVPFCVISKEDEKKQKLESGDIVFARTGATTGKSHLLVDPPRSVCASYLIRLRPEREEILPEYLSLYFQSGRYWLSVRAGMSGTAQGGFNSTKLGNMSVLVPALDEQRRIIAKVSELVTLCDELDKSLLERNVLALKMAGAFVANLAA